MNRLPTNHPLTNHPPMSHPPISQGNGLEGYVGDRRREGSGGVRPDATIGATAASGAGALDGPRRGLPSAVSRSRAVEAIAEDPAKLRLAGRLISWATAGNAVRFEKVAALRQAIEAGKYKVASGDLADKLMDGMRG